MSRRAVRAINAMRPVPKFAVVCGDLTNTFPARSVGDSGAAPSGRRAVEVAAFKAIFSKVRADVPLVCVCGNHDVGDRPTPGTVAGWQKSFGDDYFSFRISGVRFICLNSQLFKDGSGAPALAAAQESWLDQVLAEPDPPRRTIVFSHHPPFISSPDEASGYFPLQRSVRQRLLKKFARAGVTHWFCGHYHRNAGGLFRDAAAGGASVEVVTTAAVGGNIGTDPSGDPLDLDGMWDLKAVPNESGFRVVKVGTGRQGAVQHVYRTFEELEAAASGDYFL
jgi:Icc-related predicted phosphoesterase